VITLVRGLARHLLWHLHVANLRLISLCSTLLVATPVLAAASQPFKVELAGGVQRAQAVLLADGFTILVVSDQAAFESSSWRLPAGVTVDAQPLPHGGVESLLSVPVALSDVRLVRVGPGFSLEAVPEAPEDGLRVRILAPLPRTAPSVFTAPHFRQAEDALAHLRFAEARALYGDLTSEYALRPWSQVRLADLDVLDGKLGAACLRYRETAASFNDRTAGTAARLRLRALGCAASGDVTQLATIAESVRHAESAVGAYLRHELLWTIARERDPRDVGTTFTLLCQSARRELNTPDALCDALLARILRVPTAPYDVALAYLRHKAAADRHPEASALRLRAGRALVELGLAEQALPVLEPLLRRDGGHPLWRERQGQAQAALQVARAYGMLGLANKGRQLTERYGLPAAPAPAALTLEKTGLGKKLLELQARLTSLKQLVQPLAVQSAAAGREGSHEDGTL
jgi:hypothetical protein